MEYSMVTLGDMYRVWEKESHISLLHGEKRQMAAVFLTEDTGAIIITRERNRKLWLRIIESYKLSNYLVFTDCDSISLDRPVIVDIGANMDVCASFLHSADRIIILDETIANSVPYSTYRIRN